ncbi:hypothetical protein [Provencibacterium massiliense]|uniref:hypothetical protein n=2 Tax=Provencibacterium massiliense TaxID=1841868 RepID=UPI0009A68DA8|nr:hypothetical protein [Provencibacterium massiliense]
MGKNRIMAFVLAAALALCVLPVGAAPGVPGGFSLPPGGSAVESRSGLGSGQPRLGNTVTVPDGDGIKLYKVNSDATYLSARGGSLVWEAGSRTATLHGLDLAVNADYGLFLPEGTTLVLEGESRISVSGKGSWSVLTSGDLTVRGTGSLSAEGESGGLYCLGGFLQESGRLALRGAVSDGLLVNGASEVRGGRLEAEGDSSGILVSPSGSLKIGPGAGGFAVGKYVGIYSSGPVVEILSPDFEVRIDNDGVVPVLLNSCFVDTGITTPGGGSGRWEPGARRLSLSGASLGGITFPTGRSTLELEGENRVQGTILSADPVTRGEGSLLLRGGGSLTVESGALGIPAVVLDGGIELSEGMRLWAGADEASAVETRTYAGERWLHVESPAPPPVPAPARRRESRDAPYEDSSRFSEDETGFWRRVAGRIGEAGDGETVTARAGGYTRLPDFVLRALRENGGASLAVEWDGGEFLITPGDGLPSGKVFYLLSGLQERYGDEAGEAAGDGGKEKQNPGTGGCRR